MLDFAHMIQHPLDKPQIAHALRLARIRARRQAKSAMVCVSTVTRLFWRALSHSRKSPTAHGVHLRRRAPEMLPGEPYIERDCGSRRQSSRC